MPATLSAAECLTADSGTTTHLTCDTPARKECLSEFSILALIAGASGLSGLLWIAIFAVI